LEDRIVKEGLKDGARMGFWQVLTRKPMTATVDEVTLNPRSRSAKLRSAEKVGEFQAL
jgi:16S rRNA (cytosine1402-N4)-methyltransferase